QPVTASAFNQLQRSFYALATLVLVVFILYVARLVLLPVVAAILLAFILSPLVSMLQAKGSSRIVAVILVVCLLISWLGLVFALIAGEFNNLAREIPQYKTRIIEKIDALRGMGEESLPKNLLDLFHDITKDFTLSPQDVPADQKGPIPVTVESSFLP